MRRWGPIWGRGHKSTCAKAIFRRFWRRVCCLGVFFQEKYPLIFLVSELVKSGFLAILARKWALRTPIFIGPHLRTLLKVQNDHFGPFQGSNCLEIPRFSTRELKRMLRQISRDLGGGVLQSAQNGQKCALRTSIFFGVHLQCTFWGFLGFALFFFLLGENGMFFPILPSS